jgi:glycosyltransferase involved in cell wall biosynthesis
LLKGEDKIPHKLVLGGILPDNKKLIRKGAITDVKGLIEEFKISAHVCLPGFIEEDDLPALYSLADLFVYPSLLEGFGLPVLEAMCCGTPVVASSRSSIPEIVDRDELLFDPMNIESIKGRMKELLSNHSLRRDVSGWGIERAKDFSWRKTALRTLQVYKDAYNS